MLAPSIGTANVVVTWPSTVSSATAGALSLYGYAQVTPEASKPALTCGRHHQEHHHAIQQRPGGRQSGAGMDVGDLAPGSGQTQQFINAAGATTSGGAMHEVRAPPPGRRA